MAWARNKKAKMSVQDILAHKTYVKTLCPRVKSLRYTLYVFAAQNPDKSENYVKQDFTDVEGFIKALRAQLTT